VDVTVEVVEVAELVVEEDERELCVSLEVEVDVVTEVSEDWLDEVLDEELWLLAEVVELLCVVLVL